LEWVPEICFPKRRASPYIKQLWESSVGNPKFYLEIEADEYRNGWGASAVDAFDTAIIMQLPDIVDTILEYIPTINYDATSSDVSLFETTIRYLGGMLSGD
jgi:hypothetical protein